MDLVNEVEARVLGALLEKCYTTPDYYPLSLNALVHACNQKSNRWPVVQFDETTVVRGLEGLKGKKYAVQSNAGRVVKYSQTLVSTLNFITEEAALLTVLLLRGPQTLGELRGRTERIWQFESLDEVEECLENLIDSRYVVKLPKQPGRKEARFAHLFCGEPENIEELTSAKQPSVVLEVQAENERLAVLEEKVSQMADELQELRAAFQQFKSEFE